MPVQNPNSTQYNIYNTPIYANVLYNIRMRVRFVISNSSTYYLVPMLSYHYLYICCYFQFAVLLAHAVYRSTWSNLEQLSKLIVQLRINYALL